MKVTPAIRDWVVKNASLKADATDAEVSEAITAAMIDGKITPTEVGTMSKAAASGAEDRVRAIVADEVAKSVNPKFDAILAAIGGKAAATIETKAASAVENKAVAESVAAKAYAAGSGTGQGAGDGASLETSVQLRVKSVKEMFNDTRTAATWDKSAKGGLRLKKAGMQITSGDGPGHRGLDMPTDLKRAVAGTWTKRMMQGALRDAGHPIPPNLKYNDLDRRMLEYIAHECRFVGPFDFNEKNNDAPTWYEGGRLSELHTKALLDSNGDPSGGFQAVPIEFDDLAILIPLLNGELFPYVKVQNVTSRQIQGFVLGNPAMTWGVGEGSEITPFSTDGFIGAFNNFIYPITGAMEVGLDFEADSPVNIGELVMQRFGEVFLQAMDNAIVMGSGVNMPYGIANTPAAPSGIAYSNSPSSTLLNVIDYEHLLFGVHKEYRQQSKPTDSFAFIANEVNWQRARSMAVSSTTDQRRVLGTDDYESYRLFNHRYAINEALPNTLVMAACLNNYRLYRRQGYETRVVTEGMQLATRHTRLIVVRARYGGRMELSGAMSQITGAPS